MCVYVCVCCLGQCLNNSASGLDAHRKAKTFLPYTDKTEAPRSQNQQKEGKNSPGRRCVRCYSLD